MKKFLVMVMALVMLLAVGCGGGGSNKCVLKDSGELVRVMDELKNKDGLKGKDLMVFQDISIMHNDEEKIGDTITIYILKAGTEDVDEYIYSSGSWSKPQPVQITGDGRMEDNVTPMNKIDFAKVPEMYKQLETKAKNIEGGKVKNLLVYILNRDGSMYTSWGVESQREDYTAEFDLDGNMTKFEKR